MGAFLASVKLLELVQHTGQVKYTREIFIRPFQYVRSNVLDLMPRLMSDTYPMSLGKQNEVGYATDPAQSC